MTQFEKQCHICGAVLTDGKCLSCGHVGCHECATMPIPWLRIEIFRTIERKVETYIHFPDQISTGQFGLILVDILRHAAKAFKCPEEAIWEWVDAERNNPTTDLHQMKPN